MLSTLARPLFARIGAPRAFSTSPVAQLLKSHSGAKKRFRLTGGGVYKRAQAGKQHLNTGFSGGRIARLGKTAYTTPSQTKTIRRLLAGRK
ncbi:hypothetical protein CspeluHIS016_0602100 [Cutaneotrichosporon spelunceum]|uniref:50S ribosomal protein L35 n=1 Tax=Cutaneotrichosporon spelunceum TaxID=1672016 RepID=A0AAD3TXL5_9TREE|nr:hypothetical protein CspeluHIS016_0602100 [Cutaneotrichosporon spelunceum]